jgi:hypothetical protein
VTIETMSRVALIRRKITSLFLLIGVIAGTSAWLLLRSGAERPAVASPVMDTMPVRADDAPLAVPPAELRLAAADPEAVPADPFEPVPASAPAPPFIGPVLPATTPEPASFIRLNPARPEAAPAAPAAAVATLHGPAAERPAAAPAAPPVVRATPRAVPAAGPAPQAPALAAPSNDDIHLKGIIRGTPDVALVRCEGQTYFVKTGERVAGAWEVREIKDNSAVLRNGDRVLELQIEGGS